MASTHSTKRKKKWLDVYVMMSVPKAYAILPQKQFFTGFVNFKVSVHLTAMRRTTIILDACQVAVKSKEHRRYKLGLISM